LQQTRSVFIKETSHVDISFNYFLRLWLWLVFLYFLLCWSFLSFSRLVFGSIFQCFSLFEAVVSLERYCSKILESISQEVRNCWFDDVARSERNSSQVGNCSLESLNDVGVADIEDFSREDSSIIIDFLDSHLVLEGSDLKLLKQLDLRSFNLETCSDHLLVRNDFNLSLHNLCLDVQRLEELSLLRIQSSGASSDPHIIRSNDSYFGRSFSGLRVNDLLDIREISVTEDESSVAFEEIDQFIKFRTGFEYSFTFFVVLISSLRFLHLMVQSCLH